VRYPVEGLDISAYMMPSAAAAAPPLYDLVGVVVRVAASTLRVMGLTGGQHHKGSIGGGHYTAVGRDTTPGAKWYNFDDQMMYGPDRHARVYVASEATVVRRRRRRTS
jgi:hypothetical protein